MATLSAAALADALGWGAAVLTLLTFVSVDMRRLRLLALAANAAFIGYGAVAGLLPVLALHLALVPVNLWRLNQTFQSVKVAQGEVESATPRRLGSCTPAPRGRRVRRVRRSQPPGQDASTSRVPSV